MLEFSARQTVKKLPMKLIFKSLIAAVLCLTCGMDVLANVSLPSIFSDNVVLQREKPIPVWGWAAPGEKIIVKFHDQQVSARADKQGKWTVKLKPENAGGPFTLEIQGNNRIEIKNVLVGEVWFCSGQSNMEMYVKHSYDNRYEQDIKNANNSQIRHFKVERIISDSLKSNVGSDGWKLGNDSASVAEFSSVAYFFAKKLYEELNVPIGIVNSSWGGTMVETWISKEAMLGENEFKDVFSIPYSNVKNQAPDNPNTYPSLLYNAMVKPLVPYAIRGFLWYQGESNASRAAQYKKSFPLLISDWRKQWNDNNLPFYFVQLASWMANNGNSNAGSTWAELREAQTATLQLPNTGMAVAIDIGDTKDIHPPNKKDVGLRLAAIALNKDYKKPVTYSGPVFRTMTKEGSAVRVSFLHTGKKLVVHDKYNYLKGFELAGNDHKFYYAQAKLSGNEVIVSSDSVPDPVAVRYAWADDVPEANLYNDDGFPAVPFRTDNWPGITDKEKFKVASK